jgi:hypothetical protein
MRAAVWQPYHTAYVSHTRTYHIWKVHTVATSVWENIYKHDIRVPLSKPNFIPSFIKVSQEVH